jgi:uncharacterized protein YkwD
MDHTHNQLSKCRGAQAKSSPVLQVVLLLATLSFATARTSLAQTQYTDDGTPTSLEEEIRWRINRGRFDSASENQQRGTSYTDIPTSAGPLSPRQSLSLAARHQSEDMAKKNVFQHATVTGSAYYDPVTQPNPWDRMQAEGYAWNSAGENIAAGYSGAEAVYMGWWNSTGHRVNMYSSGLREIGNGYFYWASSSYARYYTMDLGSDSSSCFFSDTVFRDLNGNGVYDAGEGIPGVAIRLRIGSTTQSYYDVSGNVGSFAIPIQGIAAGVSVTVVLSNTTSTSLTLSIPTNYSTLQSVVLEAGQAQTYGTFAKSSGQNNSGFRNVVLAAAPMVSGLLQISFSDPDVQLRWPSLAGLHYQPQWTSDLQTWNNLTPNALTGTGSNLTFLDTGPASPARFYRLRITRP